jgi:error-prone DNA polymerase
MGFYHPATLVKDAQRHGLHFLPVDASRSAWKCVLERKGTEWAVRLGFNYVRGVRRETAEAIVAARPFPSIDGLVRRAPGIRKNELRMLAEIGAFAPLGVDRRTALWEAKRALRPAGPLFDSIETPEPRSPLTPMNTPERIQADFYGTGLTIGPHPMYLYRASLRSHGVVAAADLPQVPRNRMVRVAGCVICRQRPATAKGFLFVSLEDETGIANAIVEPDLFDAHREVLVKAPYLLIEGLLQNQQGAISIKLRRAEALHLDAVEVPSHDFH